MSEEKQPVVVTVEQTVKKAKKAKTKAKPKAKPAPVPRCTICEEDKEKIKGLVETVTNQKKGLIESKNKIDTLEELIGEKEGALRELEKKVNILKVENKTTKDALGVTKADTKRLEKLEGKLEKFEAVLKKLEEEKLLTKSLKEEIKNLKKQLADAGKNNNQTVKVNILKGKDAKALIDKLGKR